MATPTYLRGWERVTAAFGRSPSFHDASLVALRSSLNCDGAVELLIHAFETTSEVDERGYFRLENHHLLSLRFEGISGRELDGLASDDTLFELRSGDRRGWLPRDAPVGDG